MKPIDFSCKHDILIRHHDGVLRPMDEPHYEVQELAPGTWLIMSAGDYHYLLAGDQEAVAIDTGYGAGNLREFLEKLAGKPVRWVVNTHEHFDHTANNAYFDRVFASAESAPLLTIPFPSFEGVAFPKNPHMTVVGDGDIIPLKGRELEVFRIGDHTPGGIALLDRRERLLFTGDEFMPGMKRVNGSVEKLLGDMEKLLAHRGDYDRLCGGPALFPAEEVALVHEAARRILAGEPGEAEDARPSFHSETESWEGHPVYDWKRPRPMDMNGGKPLPAPTPDMAVYVFRGRRFLYSRQRLREA